jgi:hypothetical protein
MIRSSVRPNIPKISGVLLACAFAAATLLGSALSPAQAAPRTAYYQATLASALDEPRKEVIDGVIWNCTGDSCAGNRSGSRPVIVCGRLANKVGEIASFTTAGKALDAKGLAECNKS